MSTFNTGAYPPGCTQQDVDAANQFDDDRSALATEEEDTAEAWEYWHQRAILLETEVFQMRAALREIHVLTRDLTGVRDIVDRAINDREINIGRTLPLTTGEPTK
jgi:hypothetical protein